MFRRNLYLIFSGLIGLTININCFGSLSSYVESRDLKFKTKSFILFQDGEIRYSYSAPGKDLVHPHRLWSVTKSITSLIVGALVTKEQLTIELSLKKCLPLVSREDLTLKHVLEMSSGLKWNETYENDPLDSDVLAMLYLKPHYNMAEFVSSKNFEFPPGIHWAYSSGETNLITGCLKNLFPSTYEQLPWSLLFEPLDIHTAVWERDNSGTFIGSSYLFLSPMDLLKIGRLILNQGVWDGQRILSQEWVQYLLTLNTPSQTTSAEAEPGYSAQWWLNVTGKLKKFHPQAPEDTLMALGHHGQFLIVIPSKQMVIVRTGEDTEGTFSRDVMFEEIFKGE